MEILSTKNNYPWYDSQWLNAYVQAKELIKHHYPPALLEEFVTTMDVLKTRTDFQVVKQSNIFDKKILVETRELIGKLLSDELEKEEFFNFGRLVIHDHTYFNQLQNTVTEFIRELPQGFDTLIGDQGVKLSGGQKQRLALARALLKDAPILVLDEATAMFDPEGEERFIEECHDILHQRTVILITHRPASLALAGRVLKMEEGRLN